MAKIEDGLSNSPSEARAQEGPLHVFIERASVETGQVKVKLLSDSAIISVQSAAPRPFDWPLKSNAVDHLRCEHVLEYLNGTQRIAFMEECGRVLRVGGTFLITFFYATSRQASCDPMFQWPPLTEFSFDYFSRSWREENGCAYPITCDFDFNYKCDLDPSLLVRNEDFQRFTTKHYNQSVIKMHGLMTRRS